MCAVCHLYDSYVSPDRVCLCVYSVCVYVCVCDWGAMTGTKALRGGYGPVPYGCRNPHRTGPHRAILVVFQPVTVWFGLCGALGSGSVITPFLWESISQSWLLQQILSLIITHFLLIYASLMVLVYTNFETIPPKNETGDSHKNLVYQCSTIDAPPVKEETWSTILVRTGVVTQTHMLKDPEIRQQGTYIIHIY